MYNFLFARRIYIHLYGTILLSAVNFEGESTHTALESQIGLVVDKIISSIQVFFLLVYANIQFRVTNKFLKNIFFFDIYFII